ncbi:MAG: hypothetical protein WC043_09955 [Pseudobdellovibrionaceae bacterium]
MKTPLKNITQPSISTLLIRGGTHSPLGFIFILFGLGAVAVGLQIIPINNAEELGQWGFVIFTLIGAIFTGVGAYTAIWSSTSLIDKSRGILTYRAGFFGLGKARNFSLTDFSAVELGFNEGDSDTSDSFPLRLHGSHGQESPILYTTSIMKEADQGVKLIANFLGWPILDRTLGENTHIAASTPKNFVRTKPELPAPTQIILKDMIGETEITFPCPNMLGSSLISAIAPLLFLVFLFWDTLVKTPEYGFMALGLAIGIGFGVVKWHQHHKHTITLRINTNELTITGDITLPRDFKVPVASIRSLSLHTSPPENNSPLGRWNNDIVLQTGEERFKIARGLSAADTIYIYETLKTYV